MFLEGLREICDAKGVLPKSSKLSESLFECVYEGFFNGSRVRIRRVRVREGADPRKVEEVCTLQSVSIFHPLMDPADLPPACCNIEILETPEHRSHYGRNNRPSPAHFRLDTLRRPSRIHQKQTICGQTFSRTVDFFPYRCATPDSLLAVQYRRRP